MSVNLLRKMGKTMNCTYRLSTVGDTNYFDCTCPKQCSRHGRCCACVAHHRKHGKLPHCLRAQEENS